MQSIEISDIVVRISVHRLARKSKTLIGKMFEIYKISGDRVYYGASWSMRDDEYRKATKEESAAYHKGIRHINNINKKTEAYAIY